MDKNHHERIKRLRSYIDGRMVPVLYITAANIYELTVINVTGSYYIVASRNEKYLL